MLSFSHTTPEKWETHQEPELKGHVKSPVPLNGHPRGTFQLQAHFFPTVNLPAHSYLLQPLPSLPIPSCLLLTNSQPLLPHFPLFPLPFPFTSLHPTSSPLHSELNPHPQSCRLPSRPSVSPSCPRSPGPRSPSRSLPRLSLIFPFQRRLGSPPPDRSRPSLSDF